MSWFDNASPTELQVRSETIHISDYHFLSQVYYFHGNIIQSQEPLWMHYVSIMTLNTLIWLYKIYHKSNVHALQSQFTKANNFCKNKTSKEMMPCFALSLPPPLDPWPQPHTSLTTWVQHLRSHNHINANCGKAMLGNNKNEVSLSRAIF